MTKLPSSDEKEIEKKFRLTSLQTHLGEEKKLIKDYALVIGTILLIIGLLASTMVMTFGVVLAGIGLSGIIYKFLPW